MTLPDESGFYIGYHPNAPADTARTGRRLIVALVGGAAVLGALIASRQPRADPSVFEYGIERSFEGQIVEHPYPALLVPRPGITDRDVAYSRYLLVAQGKHGAQELVKGLDGGGAELKGSLIYRDGETMVEVAHAASKGAASAPPIQTEILGRFILHGEIVDSKCYLGVMRPGSGAVHRGCATRCLSGGAPPLLIVHDATGPAAFILLTGPDGAPLPKEKLLKLVATPVVVVGQVLREGDVLMMRIEEISD
ncbi:MAG TPA: hypothetical protein VL853_02775 [Gemmatimonadales bacterium]|nr:hypothetical protein [Gemmatimonadales bacterium]